MDSPLIYQLFSKKQADSLVSLYGNEDKNGKSILYRAIANQLGNSTSIIIGNDLNQLVLLMTEAHFIISDEEPVFVATVLFWGLKQVDVLPKVSEDNSLKLGLKCLISLSLYESALSNLQKRFGAPSPHFYRDIGKAVLKNEKYEEVSLNFDKWTNYIHNRLV